MSPVVPSLIGPRPNLFRLCVNVSQIDGPLPSAFGEPSIW